MKTFERTAKTLSVLHNLACEGGPQLRNNDWPILAALTPPILAAFALTEIGAWCIDEIGRQIRIHEKRPASPSLRGTPTPQEIAADWADQPRSLETCLRLGSRLTDLDPTLDHTLLREKLPNGKLVIRSRKGGMKGWLADHRVKVGYSTVMRYKKLAQRLRQVLSIDDRLPLEWLLSGLPADQSLPDMLLAQYQSARRCLARLIRENRSLKALSLTAEKALGIVRIVAIRKPPSLRRSSKTNKKKSSYFSIISQNRSVTVTPSRLEATKSALSRILQARNLSGPALHLQNRIRHWLSSLPPPAAPAEKCLPVRHPGIDSARVRR